MENVLVSGGAGYIGSHTCKLLNQRGITPVVFDNLSQGHALSVKWGPFVQGDIRDEALLKKVIRKYQIKAVLHFASSACVGESVLNPEVYYENNVGGGLGLLKVMRETGVKKIVFSSSCATYGYPQELPLRENHPQNPVSPYGRTKLIVEKMLNDFRTAYGIKSISLRYFNAAGADLETEIGEMHHPETHLIPLVLDVALGKLPHITIFGKDYETRDGTCVRDYIHVSDLAEAHFLALKALAEPIDGGNPSFSPAYNLGNGKGFSVLEVIEAAEKLTGKKISRVWGDRRPGDPATLVADSTHARKELHWSPQFQDIEQIIKTALDWKLKNI